MTDQSRGDIELVRKFFPQDVELVPEFIFKYNEMLMKYNSAIREVRTKFEILNDELSLGDRKNPIASITSRTKTLMSIVEKLNRMGKQITIDEIMQNLNDVAGIRVICSFVDDIYNVSKMLARQDDITVIDVKDYIKTPKPNGYRSYHMIVEVPVFFSDRKQPMRVEVQIRTMAMDFWASLEHSLKYKNKSGKVELIAQDLKDCAEIIAQTDLRLQNIRDYIEQA